MVLMDGPVKGGGAGSLEGLLGPLLPPVLIHLPTALRRKPLCLTFNMAGTELHLLRP